MPEFFGLPQQAQYSRTTCILSLAGKIETRVKSPEKGEQMQVLKTAPLLLLLLVFACAAQTAHAQYYTCVEGNYYVIAGNLYYSGDICGLAYPAPEGGWFVQCDATGYQFYNYEEQLNGGFYDPEE